MTLVKWTPRRSIFNMLNGSQLMNVAFNDSFFSCTNDSGFKPLINVNESVKEYQIMLDLPGMDKKDIHVSLDNKLLTISGNRKQFEMGKDADDIWNEVSYGAFVRSFELPSSVDEGNIKANFKNGVLAIFVPKVKNASSNLKEITVH